MEWNKYYSLFKCTTNNEKKENELRNNNTFL